MKKSCKNRAQFRVQPIKEKQALDNEGKIAGHLQDFYYNEKKRITDRKNKISVCKKHGEGDDFYGKSGTDQ